MTLTALPEAAEPVVDQLAEDLGGSPMAVLLSDSKGDLIDRRVADPSLRKALDSSHPAGAGRFARAGAPISDPVSGRTLGAIGIVCFTEASSDLMRPLVRRAAREIEARLVDDAAVSRRLVVQRFLEERRRAKGPIALIADGTMLTNAAASRLLTSEDERLLRDLAVRMGNGDVIDGLLSGGKAVTVRAERLRMAPSLTAALLRLTPIADVSYGTRRAAFGWKSLTSTELAVVESVAEGLTNQQAGERLFMSRHTVDFHLRSVFRKLDVRSRVDLARLVAARRLDIAAS
jgi:DNA-binding CsgD family transcriptional regulator